MPTNEWTDERSAVYPYNGTVLSHKKEPSTNKYKTWANLENVLSEKTSHKHRMLYDSIYVKCPDNRQFIKT